MYRHILVALDHSALSRAVLQQAIALAKPLNAQLTLLHVLSSSEVMSPNMPLIPVPEYYPPLSATTLELYQEEWQAFEARSTAMLESYRSQAEAAGLTAHCLQSSGSPGTVICNIAKSVKADLIMVGRRGHSGLSELIIGSVSNYVVHHAPCTVLVCNPDSSIASAKQTETSQAQSVA